MMREMKKGADELYQNHGDHIDCIMPPEDFLVEYLPKILEESKMWRCVKTQVTDENMCEEETDVFSLIYGENDLKMLTLIVVSKSSGEALFMSTFPIARGVSFDVKINKVIKWDNQIEATILCSIGEFEFAFFAVDYSCNKSKYKVGKTISIDLSAWAIRAEEAERGFKLEGQDAIDWLEKIGEKPSFDENGNVNPIEFSLENLVAFLPKDPKCPDEAEFQSPVSDVESCSILNVDFLKTNIAICREQEESDLEVIIPLYFRKEFFPDIKQNDPLRGYLWVTGCLSSNNDLFK